MEQLLIITVNQIIIYHDVLKNKNNVQNTKLHLKLKIILIYDIIIMEIKNHTIHKGGSSLFNYLGFGPKEATMPTTITDIKAQEWHNKDLEIATIPDTVKNIGSNAFAHNRIKSIVLPDSVESIGILSFANNKITTLTLSNLLTIIPLGAFKDNKISNIVITNSVKKFIKMLF